MLNIFTIVLDGMPFIGCHLPVLNTLEIDWHWVIAEGAAMNVKDTAWCQPTSPRLSQDGTSEYLASIYDHPRVTVIQKPEWNGKVEMVNACLEKMTEKGILLQMDSDECWTAKQLEGLVDFFNAYDKINSARFFCRYFVGPNLIITSENTYGNKAGEWHRAWRFEPAMKFLKHEPPILNANTEPCATREQTRECDLVFQHYSYALESQVAFKERYYGYKDAVHHWKQLQSHTAFPAYLGQFLPWVKDDAVVDQLYKPNELSKII